MESVSASLSSIINESFTARELQALQRGFSGEIDSENEEEEKIRLDVIIRFMAIMVDTCGSKKPEDLTAEEKYYFNMPVCFESKFQ